MPIQFRCHGCQGWIEVDDEHAGAKAICPFCQAVNSVPRESEQPIPARPAQSLHTGVPTEPNRSGRPEVRLDRPSTETERLEAGQGRFDAGLAGLPTRPPATTRLTRIGMISLLMAILSIVFMAIPAVIVFSNLPASLRQQMWQHTPTDAEAFRQLQEQVEEQTTAYMKAHAALSMLGSLGLLFWLVSLVLSISVIFSAGMHRRTYAWAGLVVNTFLLFACLCSGMMQRLAGS